METCKNCIHRMELKSANSNRNFCKAQMSRSSNCGHPRIKVSDKACELYTKGKHQRMPVPAKLINMPQRWYVRSVLHINLKTEEGRLLFAAIAKITSESQTDKTPDQVLKQINELRDKIFIKKEAV